MKELELKKIFDRVKIKHFNTPSRKETRVGLVKGNKVFFAIACCNPEDQFNRHTGKCVALGRAYHEYQVHTGETQSRGIRSHSQVLEAESIEGVEVILDREIFLK